MLKISSAFLLLTLSLSTFAGTFVQEDEGSAQWTLQIKSREGQLTVNRSGKGIHSKDLTYKEQRSISDLVWLSSLGTIINSTQKFELTDERSQETVIEQIKLRIAQELPLDRFNVLSSEVVLSNLNCEEKGFLKKRLECSAQFKAETEVSLK